MRTLLYPCISAFIAFSPAVLYGCHDQPPRAAPGAPEPPPSRDMPPVLERSYSLWIDTSGLADASVRLSLGGRRVLDVHGDGRVLAISGLSEGASYDVRIDKASEGLTCLLFADGSQKGLSRASGQVRGRDVMLTLGCLANDVRLEELSVYTVDARVSPVFAPETLNYVLDGYQVNQRAWLTVSPSHPQTTMRVRLDGVELDTAAGTLELDLGAPRRTLEVELTAPAGNTRTYHVDLTRRAEPVVRARLGMQGADTSIPVQAMAISQEYLALGAPWADLGVGRVEVFRRTPDGWLRDATLTPAAAPATQGGYFGQALSLWGDWLAVAAPALEGETPDQDFPPSHGKVFVYQRTEQGWVERALLAPPEPRPTDRFGVTLAMRGELLAVANVPEFSPEGSVELYQLAAGDGWQWQRTVRGDGDPFDGVDHFGRALALDDTHLVVGADGEDFTDPYEEGLEPRTGAVYVFALNAPDDVPWKLENPGHRVSSFGSTVAIRDGLLALGFGGEYAPPDVVQTDAERDGAVQVLRENGVDWLPVAQLSAPMQESPAAVPPVFGQSVAVTADAVWVGAPYATGAGDFPEQGGMIYRYARTAQGVDPAFHPAPVLPSAPSARLGWTLAESPDGVLCISEPRAATEAGMFEGRVTLLH